MTSVGVVTTGLFILEGGVLVIIISLDSVSLVEVIDGVLDGVGINKLNSFAVLGTDVVALGTAVYIRDRVWMIHIYIQLCIAIIKSRFNIIMKPIIHTR